MWTASVGALHNLENRQVCTATLVQQDVILTAAHCLSDGGTIVASNQLAFVPNEGAAPVFQPLPVLAVQATGSQVQQGVIEQDTAVGDWALLRITPAPAELHPLAVNVLRWAEIEARLAAGDQFFSGGYGKPGRLMLTQHPHCQPVDAARFGQFLDDGLIASDCLVQPRDSGGPMVLIDIVGRPHVIAVISGIARPFSDHPFGIGVESKSFIKYFNNLNISAQPAGDSQQPAG
jgi:V8-like Glu-specific endopeptidase